MTKRNEPQVMRELHELRERLYNEHRDWSDAQWREYYARTGGEIAKQLGLRRVPHKAHNLNRRPA